MAVFPEQLDRLNIEDVPQSLTQMERYIRYMVERMEFANSNTTRIVSDAGISNTGIYKAVITIADTVAVLQSNLNLMNSNLTTLAGRVTEMQDTITGLQSAIEDLTARVETLEGGSEA